MSDCYYIGFAILGGIVGYPLGGWLADKRWEHLERKKRKEWLK